jgi:hypothetical protein
MPRSITGIDPGELIERFLTAQGVRVDHALQDLEHAKAREARDARERLDCAGRIYLRLRQAKQAAANEQNGWLSRASGFSWDRVLEARERVALLEAHYDEACLHDDEIKAEVARRSSW